MNSPFVGGFVVAPNKLIIKAFRKTFEENNAEAIPDATQ